MTSPGASLGKNAASTDLLPGTSMSSPPRLRPLARWPRTFMSGAYFPRHPCPLPIRVPAHQPLTTNHEPLTTQSQRVPPPIRLRVGRLSVRREAAAVLRERLEY